MLFDTPGILDRAVEIVGSDEDTLLYPLSRRERLVRERHYLLRTRVSQHQQVDNVLWCAVSRQSEFLCHHYRIGYNVYKLSSEGCAGGELPRGNNLPRFATTPLWRRVWAFPRVHSPCAVGFEGDGGTRRLSDCFAGRTVLAT